MRRGAEYRQAMDEVRTARLQTVKQMTEFSQVLELIKEIGVKRVIVGSTSSKRLEGITMGVYPIPATAAPNMNDYEEPTWSNVFRVTDDKNGYATRQVIKMKYGGVAAVYSGDALAANMGTVKHRLDRLGNVRRCDLLSEAEVLSRIFSEPSTWVFLVTGELSMPQGRVVRARGYTVDYDVIPRNEIEILFDSDPGGCRKKSPGIGLLDKFGRYFLRGRARNLTQQLIAQGNELADWHWYGDDSTDICCNVVEVGLNQVLNSVVYGQFTGDGLNGYEVLPPHVFAN